jgi:hypothetical protein
MRERESTNIAQNDKFSLVVSDSNLHRGGAYG